MRRLLFPVALVLMAWACAIFVLRSDWFGRFWRFCLVVSVPMEHADALIIPGGESLARPQVAAKLYKQGVAPKVFVTGIGDACSIRKVLLSDGVPSSSIFLETKARTTCANARLLKPLLEAEQVHSALIVTSPFHTRRALGTFRKVMPGIRFGVTDASIGWWGTPLGMIDANRFAAIEFLKTAEYWALYGVRPILREEGGSGRVLQKL